MKNHTFRTVAEYEKSLYKSLFFQIKKIFSKTANFYQTKETDYNQICYLCKTKNKNHAKR